MIQPTECQHCGLHATWHIDEDTVFACGTIYAGRGDYWNQSTGCVEIMQSRRRIQRALEAIKTLERYTVSTRGYFLQTIMRSDVIEILEGVEDDTDE